jgi:hypothetical protein
MAMIREYTSDWMRKMENKENWSNTRACPVLVSAENGDLVRALRHIRMR